MARRSKRAKKKKEQRTVSARDRVRRREEESSGGFTSLKIPDGLTLHKTKGGTEHFDVIPFIAGKHNKYFEEGNLADQATYFVHKGIGVKNSTYCCPAEMLDKRCPICEEVARLYRTGNDEDKSTADALRAKKRELYLILVREDNDAEVRLFDMSYHMFGKKLEAKLERLEKKAERGGASAEECDAIYQFANVQDGKTIEIDWEEKKFAGFTYYEASEINLIDREEEVDVDVDDQPTLDEIPKILDYDKLKEIFLQGGEEEEEEEEKPKSRKKSRKPKEPEPEEDEDEDDWEDEDDDDWEDEEDEEEDEEAEEEEEPEEEEDDEDDWEEDDEDDDWDDEDDEDDDWDDEEEEDDDWDDEEEEEEEEPEPPPKKKRRSSRRSKK